MSRNLEKLSVRYTESAQTDAFFAEVLDAVLTSRGEAGLSPELVIAMIGRASLEDMTEDG